MRIRQIQLQGFKRFSDTTIAGIPETARLVVMIGPNGSGKSSLIDAVYAWHGRHWAQRHDWDPTYHQKQGTAAPTRVLAGEVQIQFHDPQPANEVQRRKAIYVRTAYRNDPEFELNNLSKSDSALKEHRFNRLIENDQAVSKNYARLAAQGLEDAVEKLDAAVTLGEFRVGLLGDIRDAMARLFPGLVLNSLGNPLTAGTFKFDKGESKGFHYKNLSGGEKAAFDLISDIIIKRREFDDTVFFIDEPEAHMGVRLQSGLLSELLGLIPGRSQLWLSTHSIGMIRRAREIGRANPADVVFLDFDGRDFDAHQEVRPAIIDRAFWKRAIQVALDDVADLVAPERVILCEGEAATARQGKLSFDAHCYNTIFANEFPHVIFVPGGNAYEVAMDRRGISNVIGAIAQGVQVGSVIDRDDRNAMEIAELTRAGVKVLSRRAIESYLLDDAVLAQVCADLGTPEAAADLVAARLVALTASAGRGNRPDDLKSASGEIYVAAKRLLQNAKLGNDSDAFLRAFCAPALTRVQTVYEELRQDVFGGVAQA